MKIAVVIPALNEEDQVPAAIASVGLREPGGDSGPSAHRPLPEIVVVDAGSRDLTVLRAREAGARVVDGEPGRARQLEMGWRETGGEVIVFLHADTRLEPGWEAAVRLALRDPSVVGGAFRLRFDAPGALFRLVEFTVALRVRLFALPYGDQAIFVRRTTLENMGGVPAVALMEDLDLVQAMKRRGRVVSLAPYATTSARRYLEGGAWGILFRNALALVAWRLGVERTRIAAWVGR